MARLKSACRQVRVVGCRRRSLYGDRRLFGDCSLFGDRGLSCVVAVVAVMLAFTGNVASAQGERTQDESREGADHIEDTDRAAAAQGERDEGADTVAAEEARARALFAEGERAYASGRYEDAIAAFEESYRLSGRPLLLFSIANAYERMGRSHEAYAALRRYLPHAPASERALILARIDLLEARAAEPATPRTTETDPVAADPDPADPDPADADVAEPMLVPACPRSTELERTLFGIGGAFTVIGTALGVATWAVRRNADQHCAAGPEGRVCTRDASNALAREDELALLTDVSIVLGAAALTAAFVIWLTRPGDPATPEAAIRLSPGQVRLVGTF